MTGNLMLLRKITAGSLRLLMSRNRDTFHLRPLVLRQGSWQTPDLTPNGGCSRSTNPESPRTALQPRLSIDPDWPARLSGTVLFGSQR